VIELKTVPKARGENRQWRFAGKQTLENWFSKMFFLGSPKVSESPHPHQLMNLAVSGVFKFY
jgi:hypothetical protein